MTQEMILFTGLKEEKMHTHTQRHGQMTLCTFQPQCFIGCLFIKQVHNKPHCVTHYIQTCDFPSSHWSDVSGGCFLTACLKNVRNRAELGVDVGANRHPVNMRIP